MQRLKLGAALAVAFVIGAVAVGAIAANSAGETQVRISARQLDDGRVEFALQQDDGGGWGERQLARARYFPADPGHSRWLNTSPYTVRVEVDALDQTQSASDTASQSGAGGSLPEGVTIYRTIGSEFVEHPRLYYSVGQDEFDDSLISSVSIEESGSFESWEDPMSLWISCFGGPLQVWFSDAPLSDINDQYTVTFRFDGQPAESAVWSDRGADYAAFAPVGDVASLWFDLKRSQQLIVRLSGFSESHTASFDLDGAWDTVVQPNLEYCGRYE